MQFKTLYLGQKDFLIDTIFSFPPFTLTSLSFCTFYASLVFPFFVNLVTYCSFIYIVSLFIYTHHIQLVFVINLGKGPR